MRQRRVSAHIACIPDSCKACSQAYFVQGQGSRWQPFSARPKRKLCYSRQPANIPRLSIFASALTLTLQIFQVCASHSTYHVLSFRKCAQISP